MEQSTSSISSSKSSSADKSTQTIIDHIPGDDGSTINILQDTIFLSTAGNTVKQHINENGLKSKNTDSPLMKSITNIQTTLTSHT